MGGGGWGGGGGGGLKKNVRENDEKMDDFG